jgi:hypothetical protein
MGPLATYDGPSHAAHASLMDSSTHAALESNLTFVGIAGITDPPRPEVKGAMALCREAGMRVMVRASLCLTTVARTVSLSLCLSPLWLALCLSHCVSHHCGSHCVSLAVSLTVSLSLLQVITGDYKPTAEAICKQIGVFGETESLEGKSISGTAFFNMDPTAQRAVLGGTGAWPFPCKSTRGFGKASLLRK